MAVKIIDSRGIESLKPIDEQTVSSAPRDIRSSEHSFEERIARIASEVPDEQWAKLPSDQIENLDYYLYEKEHE
ncbi:MAG: hypothetical protein OXI60_11325 [Acidiferrobacterales bacterium]|nr:hypothetical protein [Acidiferrobacterales bacterium]